VLLRPARVLVLLAVLGRVRFPVFRRLAVLDRFVLFARVMLFGRRHDRCIDDLSAHGEVALVLQISVEQIKQVFHCARLRQRLAIEPQGLGVGNRVFDPQAEKPHEREAVAKLIFRLIVGEIVERLQHERLEDHHFVPWLAPGRTLARRVARPKFAFNQRCP
jgi:hypothetical protein